MPIPSPGFIRSKISSTRSAVHFGSGIGKALAWQLHEDLDLETMEELEVAAHDSRISPTILSLTLQFVLMLFANPGMRRVGHLGKNQQIFQLP